MQSNGNRPFVFIGLGLIVGLVLGLALGLVLGWVVLPVTWTPDSSDVAAMADAYEANTGNLAYAKARLATLSKEDQTRVFADLVRSRTLSNQPLEAKRVANLAQALGLTVSPVTGSVPVTGNTPGPTSATTSRTPVPSTASTATPSPASNLINTLIPLVVLFFAFLLLAAVVLAFLVRARKRVQGDSKAAVPASSRVLGPAKAPRKAPPAPAAPRPAPAAPKAAPSMPPTTTTAGALGRFVASYAIGNDNYDTSFSLESPRQEFLGECGMGVSETIGEGKPDQVAAFDLWLFDKADVRTVTLVLVSEYAFKDQALRAKLGAKGEAILAEKGKVLTLETRALRITAQIVELTYATTVGSPPNSHFQKLTLEIVPTMKEMVPA